eukprot:TRINITY_DN68030_c10_g1_i1.p1 TRINITY_DN68030_c10_g1~~TRINITY_DN68030_c10_g1_i1.p1  ORF type:complete len:461 (-),score=13.12 TRINITY_DN68030_c10_g1_i1:117-1499(-)
MFRTSQLLLPICRRAVGRRWRSSKMAEMVKEGVAKRTGKQKLVMISGLLGLGTLLGLESMYIFKRTGTPYEVYHAWLASYAAGMSNPAAFLSSPAIIGTHDFVTASHKTVADGTIPVVCLETIDTMYIGLGTPNYSDVHKLAAKVSDVKGDTTKSNHNHPALAKQFADSTITGLLGNRGPTSVYTWSDKKIVLTGHGLGGTLAQLHLVKAFYEYTTTVAKDPAVCITFGAPPAATPQVRADGRKWHWLSRFTGVINENDPYPALVGCMQKPLFSIPGWKRTHPKTVKKMDEFCAALDELADSDISGRMNDKKFRATWEKAATKVQKQWPAVEEAMLKALPDQLVQHSEFKNAWYHFRPLGFYLFLDHTRQLGDRTQWGTHILQHKTESDIVNYMEGLEPLKKGELNLEAHTKEAYHKAILDVWNRPPDPTAPPAVPTPFPRFVVAMMQDPLRIIDVDAGR